MRPIVRIESAVDYITCTTSHAAETSLLIMKAEKMAFREMDAGNVVEPWRGSGFSGWKVGQVVHATRGEEGLAQLSGALAGYDWFDIYQLADRVTRIDVQETYRLSSDVTKHVLAQYKRANDYSEKKNLHHVNDVWRRNDGGATAYLGSPKSERRMRIYNKHVESKLDHYAGCVRYELQLRDDSARLVASRLSSGASCQTVIRQCIQQFARGRGLHAPAFSDCGMPISLPHRKPDCQVTLAWIEAQVGPSIRMLISRGWADQLVQALKLSHEEVARLVQSLKHQPDCIGENQCPVQSTESP